MKIDEFIYSWLKDLVILFAIISLIDLIIPKGSIKKHINLVIGLLIIYMVMNPFINIRKLNFNLDKEVFKKIDNDIYSNINKTENYEEIFIEHQVEIEKVYKEKIREEVHKIVYEDGKYDIYDIDIKLDNSEDKYGYINEITIVLYENSDKRDINIKVDLINSKKTHRKRENDDNFVDFKKLISERLELDIKNINIYEKQ